MTRILITGSNSGFGKLAALSLARQGHEVVATMRTVSKGDDLRSTAAAEELPIEVRQLDVSDVASVAEAIGDPQLWEDAENALRKAMERKNLQHGQGLRHE